MPESNSFDESISPFDFNFDDYKIVSNDSGNDFLYITLLFCVATQILLPFLASWGRKLDKLQKLQDLEEGCGDHVDETGAYDVNYNKAPINNRSETEKKIDTDRKDMSPNPIDSRISFDANAKYENNVPVEVKARTSIGDPSLSFESEGGKLLSPVSAITLDVPVLASKERKDLTEDFASKDILTATNKFHTKHDRIKENQHLSQNLRHHSANMPNIHTVQNERMHSNSALLPKTQMKTVKPRDDLPFDEPNDRDIAKDSLNIQDLNTIRGEQVYYVKDQKDIMMNIDPKQAAIIFGIDAGDQEDIVKDVDNYYQCNIEKKRENVTNEDAEDVIENSKRENKSKNEGDYDQYRIEKKDERIRNNDAEDSICDNMSMDDTYTDSFNNPMQNKLKALVNSIATPPVNRGRSTIARNIIDTVPAPELPDHKLRAKFAQQPDPRIPGNSHATFEGNQFMPIPAYRSRSKGVKITDVGIGGRRRQNSLTRRARVTKQIEQYDREDTSTSRTNDLLHNTRQTGDQITSSDSLYSRSHVNGSEIASAVSFQPSRMSRLSESALLPQDAVDAMDEGVERTLARQLEEIRKEDEALHLNYIEDSDICCGDKACWKPATIYKAWDYLLQIANCDDETILILKISVPFTVCEMTETISESLILVLLNYNVGTGAVAAYAVVQMMMRISFEFLRGIVDAQRTLCADAFAQAMGAKQQNLYHNPYLAGQYAQLCTLLYVVTLIPCSYVWFFYMENILTMLGIDEHVAQIGQQFARIAVCRDMIKGTNSGVEALLEVVNREEFCMGMRLLRCLVILITVAVVLILYDIDHSNTDSLKYVAYIQVTVHFIFFMLNIAVSFCKGWMVLFSAGLCRSIALLNKEAVFQVIKAAIPLALGSFLASGEWEILTIFAAYLGPAEVVTWAIIRYIWDIFESTSEGLATAAEIRAAYHLENGHAYRAKISTHKSMFLSVILALLSTAIFFVMGKNVPIWFTSDTTLQIMITDLMYLIGIGNIVLTMGTINWALVAAQRKNRIATLVMFLATWVITIPLAALFIYLLKIDLQGTLSSLILGYSTAANALLYVILTSDWLSLCSILQTYKVNEERKTVYADPNLNSTILPATTTLNNQTIIPEDGPLEYQIDASTISEVE